MVHFGYSVILVGCIVGPHLSKIIPKFHHIKFRCIDSLSFIRSLNNLRAVSSFWKSSFVELIMNGPVFTVAIRYIQLVQSITLATLKKALDSYARVQRVDVICCNTSFAIWGQLNPWQSAKKPKAARGSWHIVKQRPDSVHKLLRSLSVWSCGVSFLCDL